MRPHWLSRPENVRRLWRAFVVALALTVGAQFLAPVHGYFAPEEWPAFSALFGFLACVGMVLVARLIGFFLKRRDDYYGGNDG